MQPKIQIRYSPGDDGIVSALFYLEIDADIYGWYAEASTHRSSTGFFMVENFYVPRPAVLYRSAEDDVYGPWISDSPAARNQIRNPLPEPLLHELERIQSKFVQDWLFFESDPGAAAELATYQERRLAAHAVNVRSRKLHRLEKKNEMLWEHNTPGGDGNVMDFLRKHWRSGGKNALRRSSHAAAPAREAS